MQTTHSLGTLLHALPHPISVSFDETLAITGITDDSRRVQPGNLFVAYKGIEGDGHKYIRSAIAKGAAAVVCERDWSVEAEAESGDSRLDNALVPNLQTPPILVPNGRAAFAWLCAAWHGFPARSMRVVGVTGTDGKTTTSNLIYSILKAAGHKSGLISTVSAVIGNRELDTGFHVTTPEADEVQDYLAQMRAAGTTHCVLEVTSHGLQLHRVDGITFDIAAVTNITHEHLDLHGTHEAYRAAKGRLFEMARQHVLNANDDFSFEYLRAKPAEKRLIYAVAADSATVADSATAAVSAQDVVHTPTSMRIRIAASQMSAPFQGQFEVNSALIGDFNVANILAAVSVALLLEIPVDKIQVGIAALRGVAGRMERIAAAAGQDFLAVVDFAHTPNALAQCLRTLRRITPAPGRLIAVFGCNGERDVQKRPLMGRTAAELADIVIITAEDPRREPLEKIMDAIEAGARAANSAAHIVRIADRGEALKTACAIARRGDTVAALGKGHEQSMCFGTTEYPWDDRQAMRTAILERSSGEARSERGSGR